MYFLKIILISCLFLNTFASNINKLLFHIISADGRNCTATLVSESFLLTKASCIIEPVSAFSGLYRYQVDYIRKHPDFYQHVSENDTFFADDIALVKLVLPVMHGRYRLVTIEDTNENIYQDIEMTCETGYWVYQDETKLVLKIIEIKSLMFRRCEETVALLENVSGSSQEVCSKYLLSLCEPAANLSELIDNALPLMCDGKLLGLLLYSEQNPFGITTLSWLRVNGYMTWINEIIYHELYGVFPSKIPMGRPAIHVEINKDEKYNPIEKWKDLSQKTLILNDDPKPKIISSWSNVARELFIQDTSKTKPKAKSSNRGRKFRAKRRKRPDPQMNEPGTWYAKEYEYYVRGILNDMQDGTYYLLGCFANRSTTEYFYDSRGTWLYVLMTGCFFSLMIIALCLFIATILIKYCYYE